MIWHWLVLLAIKTQCCPTRYFSVVSQFRFYENKSYDLRLCVQFYRSRVNIKNTVRYIEIVRSRYVQLCDKTRKSANDDFWNQTSVVIAFVTSEHYVENCLIKYLIHRYSIWSCLWAQRYFTLQSNNDQHMKYIITFYCKHMQTSKQTCIEQNKIFLANQYHTV